MNYTRIGNTRVCFVIPKCGDIIETIPVRHASRSYQDDNWCTMYDTTTFNPDLIELLFELENFTIFEISDVFNEQANKKEIYCIKLENASFQEYCRHSGTIVELCINSARPSHIAIDLVPHEVRKSLEKKD